MNAEEARQKTLDTINGFENQTTEWDSIMKAIEEATKQYNYFQASWRTCKRMNLENWIKLYELGYFVFGTKDSTNQFLEYIISFGRVYPKLETDDIIKGYNELDIHQEIKNTY